MEASGKSRHQRVAVERADSLFELRTVAEIRAIEKATRNQIQEKQTKLRELVGESYKDVIESSDAILQMTQEAKSIVQQLGQIRHLFMKQPSIGREIAQERGMETEIQLMGSRVKYLVDSQEVIWTALDSKAFLEASRRLLRAQIIYELLQGDEKVFKKFPFLQHCWKALEQLRQPIMDRIQQEMIHGTKSMNSSIKEVESCLCAMATLEKQNSMELLHQFLQYRKLSVLDISNSFSSESDSKDAFIQIGKLVEDTFTYTLQLFPSHFGMDSEMCEIQLTAREDAIGFSGLLFESEEKEKIEESVWEQRLELIHGNLTPLTPSFLSSVFGDWFSDVAQVVHESGQKLLFSCPSLKGLSQLESEVKEIFRKSQDTWEENVESPLKMEFNIWKKIFEPIVQEKCLNLVSLAFTNICMECTKHLDQSIGNVSHRELEALGKVQTKHWSTGCGMTEDFMNKMPLAGVHEVINATNSKSQAMQIVQQFDDSLNTLLEEILEVLESSENEVYAGGDDSPSKGSTRFGAGSVRSFSIISGSRTHAGLSKRTARSLDLEPKIQSIWERTAMDLANQLHERIAKLPAVDANGAHVEIVESALLVGTVALGIAENCGVLSILSGPTEEWRVEFSAGSARASIIAPSSSKYKQKDVDLSVRFLSNAFRNVAFSGIRQWAGWVAGSLAAIWRVAIGPDKVTGREHQEEIVISHQVESEVRDEMRFSIPAAPTEVTIEILRKASIELQRLGPFSSQMRVLHLLQFLLESEFRSQLREMMKAIPQQENMDQRLDAYILQLLLDFRFLCDICSAGEPVPQFEVEEIQDNSFAVRSLLSVPEDAISIHDQTQRQDPEVKKAIIESERQSKTVENELSHFLDPIDWATYEPHLWAAESRYYRRTAVLFGSFTHANRDLHSTVDIKLPTGSESNSLNAAPVIGRLHYLPIRSFAADPAKNIRNAAVYGQRSIYSEALELEEDDQGHFLFADLVMENHTSSTKVELDVMEKFQTASFTSLGTMFTDKAAEMSALAQQRFEQFGDYLQPTGTSIFSSFTKGVSRTPNP